MKLISSVLLVASSSAFALLDQSQLVKKAAADSPQCDTEWYYYDQTKSCYFAGDKLNFDHAQANCASVGANLTSIMNVFENNFIVDIVSSGEKQKDSGMTWIGLHLVNGNWVWIDGTNNAYQYWEHKYPKDTKKHHCTYLMQDDHESDKGSKGQWRNEDCGTEMRKYVCKKPSNY